MAPKAMMATPGFRSSRLARSCEPPSGKMPMQSPDFRASFTWEYMCFWSILGKILKSTLLTPLGHGSTVQEVSLSTDFTANSKSLSTFILQPGVNSLRKEVPVPCTVVAWAWAVTEPWPLNARSCARSTPIARAIRAMDPTRGRRRDLPAMRNRKIRGRAEMSSIGSTNWLLWLATKITGPETGTLIRPTMSICRKKTLTALVRIHRMKL
mmetsp:Transcript_86538/g.222918  ORF Transcript_86538/g.222918 Transcript_86538/m.222918 type:complete len:210 (-) Transcript_86538:171-800(-)